MQKIVKKYKVYTHKLTSKPGNMHFTGSITHFC